MIDAKETACHAGNQESLYSPNIKRTIPVADDEEVNREILRVILGRDYDLLLAQDGLLRRIPVRVQQAKHGQALFLRLF